MDSRPLRKTAWITPALLIGAAGGAVWWSHSVDGTTGLAGSLAGSAVAMVFALVARRSFKASERAEGAAMIRAAQFGIIVGFAGICCSILAVRFIWPQALRSFGLTAAVVYMVYRIAEALGSQRRGTRGSAGISSTLINASVAASGSTATKPPVPADRSPGDH